MGHGCVWVTLNLFQIFIKQSYVIFYNAWVWWISSTYIHIYLVLNVIEQHKHKHMYTCTHVCMYVYENTCAGVFYKKIKKNQKRKELKS